MAWNMIRVMLLSALIALIALVYTVGVVYAQQSYPTYTMEAAYPWYYVPVLSWPAPWWNPFTSSNLIGYAGTWMPLAEFDASMGQ